MGYSLTEPSDWMLRVAELACFIQVHGRGRVCGRWEVRDIKEWLTFHSRHDQLFLVDDPQRTSLGAALMGYVEGLAIGWRCREQDLETHWFPGDPAGDCFYISQIVARRPLALLGLVALLEQRHRDWQELRLFARRRGKLVRLTAKTIIRLARKGIYDGL